MNIRHTNSPKHLRKVRIIGGQWRSRVLSFPNLPELRPSKDSTRETLFNWIGQHTKNANCLDLFAGSGALGFEALSRGAKHCVLIDRHPATIDALQENARRLRTTQADIIRGHFPRHIPTLDLNTPFSLVFLDPPFKKTELIYQAARWLTSNQLLTNDAIIYIESAQTIEPHDITCNWTLYRHQYRGGVHSHLLCSSAAAEE